MRVWRGFLTCVLAPGVLPPTMNLLLLHELFLAMCEICEWWPLFSSAGFTPHLVYVLSQIWNVFVFELYPVRLLLGYSTGSTETCHYIFGYGLYLLPAGYSDPGTRWFTWPRIENLNHTSFTPCKRCQKTVSGCTTITPLGSIVNDIAPLGHEKHKVPRYPSPNTPWVVWASVSLFSWTVHCRASRRCGEACLTGDTWITGSKYPARNRFYLYIWYDVLIVRTTHRTSYYSQDAWRTVLRC